MMTAEAFGKLSDAEKSAAYLAMTAAKDAAEKAAVAIRPLMCKVSEKGAVSVYGLQRMPVTLYAAQWERLAPFIPTLLAFIKAHPELSRK